MRPLRKFEEFLEEGIVKRQRTDISRAANLVQEAEKRRRFLKDILSKLGIADSNANYFVENAYDTIMELIRAKMFIDGFKAAGLNAHEAEVSYLRKLAFQESDVKFANELRYFRNSVVYYGKSLDAEYANKVIVFLDRIYPILEKLVKKYLEPDESEKKARGDARREK